MHRQLKLNFSKEIYNTYDKNVNNKYSVELNNRTIDRIKIDLKLSKIQINSALEMN